MLKGPEAIEVVSPYETKAQEFIDGVLTGKIPSGRLMRLAVKRHLHDLETAEERGFEFKKEFAIEVCEFSEICCLSKGEWGRQPMVLTLSQIFVVWCLFGWRRKSDGLRRFNKGRAEVARKWGKSHFVAFLCNVLLAFDNPIEEGCEGYAVATKEKQAIIVHSAAVEMVKQSPSLRRRLSIFKNRIVCPGTTGFFVPIGSDSETTDGLDPHFIVRDEQHAWRERHRGLHEKLNTGSGARRQPLDLTITTAGDDKSTIWIEERAFAEKVLESCITGDVVSDTLFAFICSMDMRDYECFDCIGSRCGHCLGSGTVKKDDEFTEIAWRKGNPNLGITVKVGWAKDQAEEARHRPEKQTELRRYVCNVRVASAEAAILPEIWVACSGELSELKGRECHGAFDLGRSNDFASVANVFPFEETDDSGEAFTRYEALSWSFTSDERPKEMQTEQIDRWIATKQLSSTRGDQVDFMDVESRIAKSSSEYHVNTWAFDPQFALVIAQRIQEIHGQKIFPFTQRPNFYNEPMRKFLALLTQTRIVNGKEIRLFKHDGCPVFAWQASNLVRCTNAQDHWMPDKGASPMKIDAMVAVLMAFSECLYSKKIAVGNYYETHELEMF